MLKFVLEKLEDVAEPLRPLYKIGGDGKYHLDVEEDAETGVRIKEFRDNNVKLMKEKEALEAKLKELGDPKDIVEMKKKIQAINDKQLIEAGKIDELVESKTERMRTDFNSRLDAMEAAKKKAEEELKKTTDRLSEVLIDSEITKAVTAIGGVRKDAMQDILSRGKRIWRLEDGKPVPKEGDRLLFGKDGKTLLSFTEWAQILVEQAPFLFESTAGPGGGGGGNKNLPNKEDFSKLPLGERLNRAHAMAAKK